MNEKQLRKSIKKLHKARKQLKKQDLKLREHFMPLLEDAVKKKDRRLFNKILDKCPDTLSKIYMYEMQVTANFLPSKK